MMSDNCSYKIDSLMKITFTQATLSGFSSRTQQAPVAAEAILQVLNKCLYITTLHFRLLTP